MSNVMDYETLDWEAEAIRVARAFELDETAKYEFLVYRESPITTMLLHQIGAPKTVLAMRPEITFECFINASSWMFALSHDGRSDHPGALTLVVFGSNGTIQVTPISSGSGHGEILAKGLYYLDLLTPKIEAELEVSVSAHQKLEWKLEYEARHEL